MRSAAVALGFEVTEISKIHQNVGHVHGKLGELTINWLISKSTYAEAPPSHG